MDPTQQPSPAENTGAPYVWEIDVPLLNNRAMVGGVLRAWGLTILIMCALMTVILGSQGEWAMLPPLWLMFMGIGAGLFVLSLLIMLIVFRNRMHFRFTLADDGLLFEVADKTAQFVDRAAVVGGVLGGSPGTAGAGMIATSQERQHVSWDGSFRAELRPKARLIVLRNAWRALLYVYCTPENYEYVASRIGAEMRAHATEGRVAKRSPLPRYLIRSALVAVACVPLFALAQEFDISLLAPLFVLCFALAMVWLIELFGYVVLAALVYLIGALVADAFSVQQSFFEPGTSFARWTVYGDSDWALIAVAGLGALYLAWESVRAVTGRRPSMLGSDVSDMVGE